MPYRLATLIALCAPHVDPLLMRALIHVESNGNPYAISVNTPETLRARGALPTAFTQPTTLLAAQRRLEALRKGGYSTSIGIAQVNSAHLRARRSNEAQLLDPCTNLQWASLVLMDCDRLARTTDSPFPAPRLYRTLSCFNTGNTRDGISNGYVAKILSAASRLQRP